MPRKASFKVTVSAVIVMFLVSACGGSGSGGGEDSNPDEALINLINQLFPYTPNQPFDVIYSCARIGSVLEYIFDFKSDGTFDLTITTDTGQDIGPQLGVYSFQNDQIRMQTGAPFDAILFNLDETTTAIVPAFGLVGAFQTANMICGAIGHRENPVEFGSTVHFDCPSINLQAVSFDVNAVEFALRTIPFNLVVPGSAFRARDRFVSGNPQALIRRGNGLYRRSGNDFYVFFAPGTFDDFNVLQGIFKNGDLQLAINQLEPQRGDCSQ